MIDPNSMEAVEDAMKAVLISMRGEAERRVIALRGSRDVPGFDACVEAEMASMIVQK